MISDEQLVEMAPRILAMVQTPGWKDYCAVISDKINVTMETAIADEPSKLLWHRGSIDGMRAAVLSAEDVLTLARSVTGEKKEARRAAIRQVGSASASSFFD